MEVILTYAELQIAHVAAGQRWLQCVKFGAGAKYGAPEDGSEADAISLQGAVGEMAVAKGLNLYWVGSVGEWSAGHDVGGCVDVRSVTKPNHCLILHEMDKDKTPYVLVELSSPSRATLVGWVYGADGKKPEYWSDPSGKRRPAFFVPRRALRPIDELVPIIAQIRSAQKPEAA